MNKRTRFKITIIALVYLSVLSVLATFRGMESIGVTAVAALMTILSSYIWGETKRPSVKQPEE